MDVEHRVLDIDDVTTEELEFQDFDHDLGNSQPAEPKKSSSFTAFPQPGESDDDVGDKEELLRGEKKQPSFWTFEYYQTWFDVDTYQVLRRISGSMVPKPRSNFLRQHIRPNPDLYGPFWICTTLVFTTAICGNLANYIGCGRYDYHWKYDFHKVTFAAAAIFSYWWLIPTAIYGLLWWRGSQAGYSYMEIICVYGYSLAVYIPISILWVVPFQWVQWTLVLVGMLLSGCVLMFTFWPAVREDDKKVAWGTMALILLFHGLLATGFMLYFFHVPISACPQDSHKVVTTHVPPTVKPTGPKENLANQLSQLSVKNKGTIKAKPGGKGAGNVAGGGVKQLVNKVTGKNIASTNKKTLNKKTSEKKRQARTVNKDIQNVKPNV